MKQFYISIILSSVLVTAGCGDGSSKATGPKADYPFVPPELEKNPPMSPNDIDRIDDEINKTSVQK